MTRNAKYDDDYPLESEERKLKVNDRKSGSRRRQKSQKSFVLRQEQLL